MSVFSEKERSDILEKIITYLKNREDVLSVILVGSGANGFRDKLSDIDLAIVTDDKTDIDIFLSEYQLYLNDKFDIMINHRVPGRPLVITMLENFLEIDMSVVFLNKLCAVKNSWKVLSDKTGQAENIMQETWEKHISADISERMNNEYQAAEWGFWHYLIYASIAVYRNDLWRAYWEIQYVRDMAINLLGYKFHAETKRNRDVKLFPEEILERLKKTVPCRFTQPEFISAIKNLTDLMYDIFDEHSSENSTEFPHEKMAEFLSFALGEVQ